MNRRRFTKHLAATVGALSFGRAGRSEGAALAPALRIDGVRINRQLVELSAFGKNPYGGVSRVAYSEFDKQGRAWAMGVMREAGLTMTVDAAGNIFGRRAGSNPALKPIVFGSHIDSVPDGGNYDGDVGSLSAIEVARTLGAANLVTAHPLEVVIFQNEEGGTVGSRALIGELTAADLAIPSNSGKTIGDGIAFIGGDVPRLASVTRAPETSPPTWSCTSSRAAIWIARASTSAWSRASSASASGRCPPRASPTTPAPRR
jgi:N-carbamoyl-L-amino-acid hydrolase